MRYITIIWPKKRREKSMFWKIVAGIRLFVKKCNDDHISAYAAQTAFFIILSSIPFLMLFVSLIKYTSVTESMIMTLVTRVMPDYVAPLLVSIIHEIYTKGISLISIAAITAIWSAAKGIQYLSNGLNSVYDIEETRNWILLRLRAVVYTLVMLVAIVLSLILLIFGNSIQGFFEPYITGFSFLPDVIMRLRSLIMMAIFIFFFAIIYKMLPNRKAKIRNQLPGSILSALSWSIFSYGLSVYIDYFNGFSMYGSLTTVVLIMLWLYFCMYILLICAEINSVYEEYQTEKMKK